MFRDIGVKTTSRTVWVPMGIETGRGRTRVGKGPKQGVECGRTGSGRGKVGAGGRLTLVVVTDGGIEVREVLSDPVLPTRTPA